MKIIKTSAVVIVLAFVILSFRNNSMLHNDPPTKYERILKNVALLMQEGHYSPKNIDDSFSSVVFKAFLDDLDDDKTIFLKSDIQSFEKYATVIDDEMLGKKKLESFFAVTEVYNKRMEEVSKLYEASLQSPFDFTIQDSVVLDGDKRDYCSNEAERKEMWMKKMKYMSLVKYVDMLNDAENNKNKNNVDAVASLAGVYISRVKGKVQIDIEPEQGKKISQVLIQRSADSAKKFTTIATYSSLHGKKIYTDSSLSNVNSYYRATITYEGGTYTVGKAVKPGSDNHSLEADAREKVKKQMQRYFTTLKNHNTTDELFSTFVNAITSTMDPHSDYFAPIDQRSFNEAMSGSFYGIGAQLKEEDGKIKIASLVTGSPAWKSNEIVVNDEIIKIGEGKKEPVDVTGYAIVDAVKLIRGATKGSEVRLTIRKIDGTVKVVSLLRDEIKLDDTFAKSAVIKDGDKKIGYIYLPEFYIDFQKANGARCSDDVAKEIEKLKAEKVEGIIMDLRGNGGGSLPEVVRMVGFFIEDGPVCQVRGRDDKQPYLWRDKDKGVLYDGPLTVLVDENSASASEIFAAAIQDYKRGIIIGSSSTFGKGTVQRSVDLNLGGNVLSSKKEEDLGTVKLTLQKFYRVNGGSTQLKGVTPDVILPDRNEVFKSREKDYPTALSWDEIPNADYKQWTTTYSVDDIVRQTKASVDTQSVFLKIKQNVQWITKEMDKKYSLKLDEYKADQQQLKLKYKELDSLIKLQNALAVTNTQVDLPKVSADKEKTEKNKQFIDRIKKDIYIGETVKLLNKLIVEQSVAKKN